MPSTARQLRQLLTIKAIERVLYFADVLEAKEAAIEAYALRVT